LVLRSRKYREADCLLTLLTKSRGKVGAIAKGVRKSKSKLRGGVQVFTYNDMLLYKGRSLDTVTQSQCLEAFTPLQEDIRAITAAAYWSELLDVLIPEGERDNQLFQMALAGFHLLALSTTELIVRGLEIKLLSLLGYRPCLEKCVSCQGNLITTERVTFSVSMGGVLCPACSKKEDPTKTMFFSHEALQGWLQLLRMEFGKIRRLKISPQGLNILDRVIEESLLMQLDYPLKSRPLLKEILPHCNHSQLKTTDANIPIG
jgi:DNA repair protein RecO (recombination protein O)